jgi:hypothetical protein
VESRNGGGKSLGNLVAVVMISSGLAPAKPATNTGVPLHEYKYANCIPGCELVFDRIWVFSHIIGSTRLEWRLSRNFHDPGPYVFQLQVGHTANQNATDWCNVGLAAVDTFYMIDDTQRVYGKTQWTHYRLVLTTPLATYMSTPQPAWGALDHRNWRQARDMVRQERVRLRYMSGQEGYLLKTKLYGPPHQSCLQWVTGEVTRPQCTVCYGTGIEGGYFDPIPCVYADLNTRTSRDHRDEGQGRGTINDDLRVRARMIAIPQVEERDVWVDQDSDLRWYVHQVQDLVEVRGVPLVCEVELRLAPFTDVIYKFPIADQVPVF